MRKPPRSRLLCGPRRRSPEEPRSPCAPMACASTSALRMTLRSPSGWSTSFSHGVILASPYFRGTASLPRTMRRENAWPDIVFTLPWLWIDCATTHKTTRSPISPKTMVAASAGFSYVDHRFRPRFPRRPLHSYPRCRPPVSPILRPVVPRPPRKAARHLPHRLRPPILRMTSRAAGGAPGRGLSRRSTKPTL